MSTPTLETICRFRGDTYPQEFEIKQSDGVTPLDITGYTFVMTMNSAQNPVDTSTQIDQKTASITDGPNGLIEFSFDGAIAGGSYYYDLQQTDAGGTIRTLGKGQIQFVQDLTK